MFSLRRFARAPTLFLFLLVLLLASCATFLLFTLRLEGTPHYQDNRRLSPQNRRGPPPMANFSRQSKRRPLNLATRLTRFEQTDQSTFSSLQPIRCCFPTLFPRVKFAFFHISLFLAELYRLHARCSRVQSCSSFTKYLRGLCARPKRSLEREFFAMVNVSFFILNWSR